MAETPLVSVGVPTYNRAKTLKRAVDSLISQSYKNIEIIIADNCSSDPEVQKIIKELSSDSRIIAYRHSENLGAAFNFNFVLEKATGDFFLRLADDDWFEPNYIESCLDFLMKNPDYVGAYGPAKIYSTSGEFLKADSKIDLIEDTGHMRVMKYFQEVTHNSIYYGLIRRPHMGHLRLKTYIGIDWLIVARLAFLGKYKMLDSTNSYLSSGGLSETIDNLTTSLKMSIFTRSFPYFALGINIVRDIIWDSPVYRSLGVLKRSSLAIKCFKIVFTRYDVKNELRRGIHKYIALRKAQIRPLFIRS